MNLTNMTTTELVRLRESITSDPKSAAPHGSIWLYRQSVRRKLDEIDRAIAAIARRRKLERGEYVNDAGYSWRQSKRR